MEQLSCVKKMAPTVRHPQKLLARIVFSVVHFHVVQSSISSVEIGNASFAGFGTRAVASETHE